MPILTSSFAEVAGLSPAAICFLLGAALWCIAYVLTIRKSFKESAYGIPWPSICLNLTWELYFGFICPGSGGELCKDSGGIWLLLTQAWLVLDVIVAFQLLYFGRKLQGNPYLYKYFYTIVTVSFVLALLGQMAKIEYYQDEYGTEIAWLINMVMSLLFIAMFCVRPDQKGLSYPAAWAKLLGSAVTAAGLLLLETPFAESGYGRFLFTTTLLSDLFYVFLLRASKLQRQAPGGSRAVLDS